MLDLASLVDSEADYLFRYALRYFSQEDVAEELVQETFLAATASQERFQGQSAPRTWLTSILKHKIIDRLRKKGREIPVSALERQDDSDTSTSSFFDSHDHWEIPDGPVQWAEDPDSLLNQKQFFEVVQECLSKLTAPLRSLFLLREVEGYSQEELCNELGLTATNLRVKLHRTRLLIRDCVQKHWLGGKDST